MRPVGWAGALPLWPMPRHRDGSGQHSAIADRCLHCRRRATGLALAIAVRQHGLEVTVADGAEAPIDKTCGQCVMPSGIAVQSGPR